MTRLPLVASLTALIMPSMVHAADIYVTTTSDVIDGGDGLISLREAITQANANAFAAVGTTTVHLPAGTYTISLAGTDDSNASGDFDLQGEGGNTTIIRGAGGGATIIDGAQLDRVLDIVSGGVDVVIERLTIRNGRVIGASGASPGAFGTSASGGGIYMHGAGNFTLRDAIIEDCLVQGGDGAAGLNDSGSGNRGGGNGGWGASAEGAGIAINSSASGTAFTFERVGFYRNTIQGGNGGAGGDAESSDGSASGGIGGNGGNASGAAIYVFASSGMTVDVRQVKVEDSTATAGNGGNGGNGQTDALSGAIGRSGAFGGDVYGGGIRIDSTGTGVAVSVTDLSLTGTQATGGAGGAGGYTQNNAAANGDINGQAGGAGGLVEGAGISIFETNHVHLFSGNISNNTATGGAGGNGGKKATPGAANMYGGSGGAGGYAGGGAFWAAGEGPTAMHIQFDAALTMGGNTCYGGAGGNGAAGANSGEFGSGGIGGDAKYPGCWIKLANSLSTIGDFISTIAGNQVVAGTGGESGIGGDALSGATDATQFQDDNGFTFNDVSGKAFADTGTPDGLSTGEPGLAGVGIELVDANSFTVLDTTTTSDGTYAFSTTWQAASTLKFTTPNFSGIPTSQDVGGDDTIDSDIAADGTLAVNITSNMTNVDAGYDDPGPITGTFTLTISGKVSADVTKVSIGSTIVTPTNGTYTISVDVPAKAGSVDLITTSSAGVQSKRTIVFDKAALPSG